MLDAIDETIEALSRKDERDIRNFGLGTTDGAQTLITRHFETYLGLFKDKLEITKGSCFRGRRREIFNLDPERLTFASLESAISSFERKEGHRSESDEITSVLRDLGTGVAYECYAHAFREHLSNEAEQIENAVKRSAGNLTYRRRLLKRIAQQKGFHYEEWTDSDKLKLAEWILDVLLSGPLFVLDEDRNFTMPPEVLEEVDTIMADLVRRKPRCLPQTGEVVPWTGTTLHLDGMGYPLVRSYQKAVKKFVEREFRAGSMGSSIEALNHSQAVLWRIDGRISKLVRECYEANLGRTVGLPSLNPLPIPEPSKPIPEMSEEERVVFFKERREKRTANRGFIGERIILERTLASAEALIGQPFWTPMNCDYRGRVYAIPYLSFQGPDHVRALFQFDEGQVLTEEGLYWLKVHLANCGAFNKIDKAPFDERVDWVNANAEKLIDVALAPMENVEYWSEADSPFMFVAACMALYDGIQSKPVHIPVSFDGSCSGLQHLCAMTRAPEGSLVNLTPSERPQDVYQVVADRVKERLQKDQDEGDLDTACMATEWLQYGITRSLVKRNVMTYSYSSKARGMTDQVLEDTVRPLNFKVLTGEIPEHPLGNDWMEVTDPKTGELKKVSRHWMLANYLAKHTYAAIEEVVEGPAKAMSFLRDVAGCYAHEGKPTVWHTPLGFPVMMRYPNIKTKVVKLFLHDKSIRFQPRSAVEVPGIRKDKSKNGSSPSFVHALDACHLMMVLLRCKTEGINSVALVHDSFGCLPNEAERFRRIIKETFRDLYQRNVLEDFLEEAYVKLETTRHRLPPVPHFGTLNLDDILEADYCFA